MNKQVDHLTTKQAAEILGVSRRFILSLCQRKWNKKGAGKHGRDWIIPRKIVDEYRDNRPGRGRQGNL